MSFEIDYLLMKNEKYMSDEEIAEEMCISLSKLQQLKHKYQIDLITRPKKNSLGFTEPQLQKGERNGIPRRLIYKRYREYHWSRERAISEPIQIKRNKRRVIE